MTDLLTEMNWTLIIILVIVSAVVAYIGDLVGMRVGKKRISIFGLRPKSTSSIITVASGIIITILTLAVLSTTSQTVRTAIFSMKFVQRQITELTSQLQGSRGELEDLETRLLDNQKDLVSKQLQLAAVEGRLEASEKRLKEIEEELKRTKEQQATALESLAILEDERQNLGLEVNELRLESERLREGLEYVRGGRIVVFAGEMIAQTVVSARPSGEAPEADEVQEDLLRTARTTVAMRTGVDPDLVKVSIDPDSIAKIRNISSMDRSRMILRLIVSENTVQGEVISGKVSMYESRKIYDRDHVLAEESGIPPGLGAEEAEMIIYSILREVNSRAQRDGVLPDPLRGHVGNLSASEFFEAADLIAGKDNSSRVIVKAEEDIYTEGPVRVKIEILAE